MEVKFKGRKNIEKSLDTDVCLTKLEPTGYQNVFENQFSDSEDDTDHEQVINDIGNTNNPYLYLFDPQNNSSVNLGDSTISNFSPTKLSSSNVLSNDHRPVCNENILTKKQQCSNCKILEQVGFEDFLDYIDEQCPPLCSSCSDCSYTDHEAECSFSDEDDEEPEHWQSSSHAHKKHKNLIPVRKGACSDNRNYCGSVRQASNFRSANGRLEDRVPSKHLEKANGQFQDTSQSIAGDSPDKNDRFNKGIGDGKTRLQSDSNLTLSLLSLAEPHDNMDSHSTSGHQRIKPLGQVASQTQSSTSTSVNSHAVSSLSRNSRPIKIACQRPKNSSKDIICGRRDRQGQSYETKIHVSGSLHASQSSSSGCSSTSLPRALTMNSIYEKESDIQNHFHTKSHHKNSLFKHARLNSLEKPHSSDLSDLELWNEGWVAVDHLICPNFLKGAPLDESFFTSGQDVSPRYRNAYMKKIQQMPRKVPRMFHRRKLKALNAEREESRARRFSDMTDLFDAPLSILFKMVKEMGIDVAKVLENAGKFGLPQNIPCMQCYEKAGPEKIVTEMFKGYEQSEAGRCRKCGGQIQTLASMGKMISKLRKIIKKNKFVVRDVYPDGNCMFGTVIDQLRVRGDFRYTVQTLRKAVVCYLRENPTAEDGTPLEMFLSDESWEGYLKRMSGDGVWGDHLVLSAMANVLQTRIVIYGGRSGETETVIAPKQPESSKEVKSQAQKKRFPSIYLVHYGETHYLSLRPENWLHHLQEANSKEIQEWHEEKCEVPSESIVVPIRHIDFILRYTFQLEYISSYMPYLSEIPDDNGESEFINTLVGPIMCKMAPDFNSKCENISQDASLLFPSSEYREPSSCTVITTLQTPRDTAVLERSFSNKSFDLLPEISSVGMSYLRLLPVAPHVWTDQTMQSTTGSVCLRAVDIECFPVEGIPITHGNEELTFHRVVAFQSEWPKVANEWITRERKPNTLDEVVIETIVSLGCHVVPITSNEKQCNIIDSHITPEMMESEELWSYSFAVAEIKFSKCLTNYQRCCFLLLKSLLDYMVRDPPFPAALPKSVFFYACENIDATVWRLQPGRCLVAMLQQLENGLQRSFIPHYFISGQNLLQNAPREHVVAWLRRLEVITKQPMASLYFVLDMMDITSTEIGVLYDAILEDLPKYNWHNDILRSINETYIYSSGTVIESLIYQRDFQHAMTSLEETQEQMIALSGIPFDLDTVIHSLLPGMALGYRWCMGLFIDLMKGSDVTSKLSYGFNVVHITEVFGPDIEDEMPSTVVPEIYSISSGDLKFPTVCSDVILHAGKPRLAAKCLRYYLDTYNATLGANIIAEKGQTNSRMKLKFLQGLYMTLLEAYDEIGRPEEFRDLMPNLTMITELHQRHSSCRDLAFAWKLLGETDIAKHCCVCYGRHGLMNSLMQQILSKWQTQ